MMKKIFLKLSALLFVLGIGTNAAWAIDVSTAKIYVASMQAQSSTAAECTGAGQVQLTWIDIQGKAIANPQFVGTGTLNETNPVGPAATALMTGGTLSAMDGIEVSAAEIIGGSQIYLTSFVYFKADGVGANGSYFHEWTFNDPSITRQDTAMDKTHPESAYFKLLPDTANSGVMGSDKFNQAVSYVMTHPNNIYAVFKKYLLSNPVVVNNGTATAEESSSATINVSVDIEGDMSQLKDYYADFDLPGMPGSVFAEDAEGAWTWALGANPAEVLTPMKGRANIVITYTAKSGITAGTKRATFVAKMQGTNPSTINIPLAVEVRPASANGASVKIGDADPVEYETLAEAVTAANAASGDVTLTLLQDVSDAVVLSNKMKLDLNSYTLSNNLVISTGADVELVYNKQGGKVTNTVAVQNGAKLTLNGGTIEVSGMGGMTPAQAVVAVNVAQGGKLIQNGATISATAEDCYAIGINVDGEVEVKDGSVTAHAGMTAAFAAQVSATGKLTTTGGALNASVDQSHNPTYNPADQSTWSNAYAVYVAEAAGEANLQGGSFYSTSSYSGAFAVSALASFGKMTIGKNAVVSAHTVSSEPVAYAVGCMGSANLTVNGGRFSATYTNQAKACPPFLCAAFDKLDFKAGIIKADSVFVRADMFPSTMTLVQPKLYNVVKGGKDYVEGYRYIAVADPATQADLIAAGVPAARIGTTGYTKLEDAIDYANNNPNAELVIFMQNNYTLPAGYYTLPAKATLVIPMSDNQSKEINAFPPRVSFHDMDRSHPYEQPTEFRRLTFAKGVNMDVHGAIEMTCTQFASNEAYTAQPYGPYGHLVMEEGSHITLMANSELRAWGFMTGKGETDARRDATVREMFQLGDWKGAMTSVKITGMAPGFVADDSYKKIFPVSQYFIQNVEAPVKYHPGAVLSTAATVAEGLGGFLAVTMSASDIKVVGVNGRDAAIFLLDNGADADNTWVRKWYDAENDIQTYDINSSAHIGSMVLDMGELDVSYILSGAKLPVRLNSAKFDLPITNNMKIHLLSGSMDFLQNTSLLPGAEVEIDKESTVSVAMDETEITAYNTWKEGGEVGEEPVLYTGALYVYDAEDWDKYAFCRVYGEEDSEAYTKVVRYSPSWSGRPTKRAEDVCPPDAAINVHGTFTTATGFVYCSEHGANIFSRNEDAGTFIFNEDASEAGTRMVNNVKGESSYEERTFYPAKLKHGNGTFADTESAVTGDSYCYQEDKWESMRVDEHDDCFMVNHGVYYIKPQEYVAVAATKIMDGETFVEIKGNDDHTYSDVAGTGRLFIRTGNDCQWWEVENVGNLYHCLHPNNDTYYYWQEEVIDKPDPDDEDTWVIYPAHWEEKRFTITWKNWDDTPITTIDKDGVESDSYSVTYGTMAEFLGDNPTREATIDYTYDFTGWTPALGPVTSDVTYTATFTQKERKYTIIFCQEGGVEIERQFLKHNAWPVCENTPTKVGHTLVWSPAIAAVTKDTTYTATWLENPPTEYEVTFYDYDGTTVLQQSNVTVGAMPEYTGATPTGKATWATAQGNKEYTYIFDHWSPEIEKVSATSAKTYTAVYAESPLEYTITFKNEDNSVRETQKYHYGETPVCSNLPTKEATAQYTYKLRWNPQIQTVMADATYTAEFDATTNKYTVTLKSDPASACTFTGAGTFNYGTSVNNVAVSYDSDEYEFLGWADLPGADKTETTHTAFTLTEDITIVANFRYKGDDKVTITWKNWDGSATLGTSEPKVNAATTYTGATPTKSAEAAYTYIFDGWTTAANGAGTFYKNNQTPKATVAATYYAHFTAVPVPDLNISNDNGAPTVLSEAVNYHDLIITSDGATYSGQLVGSNYLMLTGNAHFDLAINAQNHTWYAIAVPWQVDPTSGISVNGRTLTFGKDFDILYYDGAERAAGNVAWKYLELKEGDKTIQPGTLYMIGLMMDAPVIRFTKKDGAPLLTTGTSVTTYASSEATDANWNGIANPALFAAYVNAGVTLGQVYNNDGSDSYSTINLSTAKLILGQPVFVQAPANKSITVKYGGTYAAAPRRAKATETNEFEVRLSTYGAKYTDRLFVQADEDKEQDVYTIGKDLAKMGISSKVAQMWVNRYNTKLCMNTFAPINGVAEYPLGIYAPMNGEYRLSLATMPDSETSIYLTCDGEAIWNLTNGVYAVDLEKGTNSHYGIRVTVKNAPQVTTGIDEAVVDAKGETRKVLINNQVYIIRGNKVYSIDGQLVK